MLAHDFSVLIPKRSVSVKDAPYFAKGDAKTNDRLAIQTAIDDIAKLGGGTVVLPKNSIYLSGSLTLRSHVSLCIEKGATLLQSPRNEQDYARPIHGSYHYEKYIPRKGHNYSPNIKWSHMWYLNFPMIFAEAGTHDFSVTGGGTIKMMEFDDPEDIVKICPIGFFQCSDFIIENITITNYHSYALMPFTSHHGLFSHLTIHNSNHGNGDGICLMNCHDIRVTGCDMETGDDSVYIFSSYHDPRGGAQTWWSSERPETSENIEIDHNHLCSNHCKAFGMILWGIDCPDLEKAEVRNVYVHDNYFLTMGNWLYCPYTSNPNPPPVTSMRFENNIIDGIECNFFETQVSNMQSDAGYRSMTHIRNGNFKDGRVFWVMDSNEDPSSVGIIRPIMDDSITPYGYISSFDKGDCALYQGLYIKAGEVASFVAYVRSDDTCQLFVRNAATGEIVKTLSFKHNDYRYENLEFTVPVSGNYHVGLRRGDAQIGNATIQKARLYGNIEGIEGYKKVVDVTQDGKIIYFYNEDTAYYKQ